MQSVAGEKRAKAVLRAAISDWNRSFILIHSAGMFCIHAAATTAGDEDAERYSRDFTMKRTLNCYWNQNTDATLPVLCKASRRVALLPLASIESHGPHLPLGSDTFCLEHVLQRVTELEVAAILPTLQYSYVAEARMLPGAIHVRSDLLADLVENICDEAARNGFSKLVLVHGHGGNATLHQGFMRRMLEREKDYLVYSVPVFAGQGESIFALMTSKEKGHACEFETSLNLAACPQWVNLKSLQDNRHFPTFPGPAIGATQIPVDWVSAHPQMVVGYPALGTAEKGHQVAEIWAQALATAIRQIKDDRVGPRVWREYQRRCKKGGRTS
jgi:creatinine amidohydrolase